MCRRKAGRCGGIRREVGEEQEGVIYIFCRGSGMNRRASSPIQPYESCRLSTVWGWLGSIAIVTLIHCLYCTLISYCSGSLSTIGLFSSSNYSLIHSSCS